MDKTISVLREIFIKAKAEDSRTRVAINKAMKAIEKQIEKEPEWEGGLSFLDDGAEAFCPVCGYYFKDDLPYCPECGQRMLWH